MQQQRSPRSDFRNVAAFGRGVPCPNIATPPHPSPAHQIELSITLRGGAKEGSRGDLTAYPHVIGGEFPL